MSERLRSLEHAAGTNDEVAVALSFEKARRGEVLGVQDAQIFLRSTETAQEVQALLSGANIPETERLTVFLRESGTQYQRAIGVHETHYPWLTEDDAPLPNQEIALDELMNDLRENPGHVEAINSMQKPVLRLEPVFEEGEEAAGFRRLLNAMDNRRRSFQQVSEIWDELQTWNIPNDVPKGKGKVIGWRVVVGECQKDLPRESNPWAGLALEDQMSEWQSNIGTPLDVHLPTREGYQISQMLELSDPNATSGIDTQYWSFLEDTTRQTVSFVPCGRWNAFQVDFNADHPDARREDARFRFSVVVKKIL